MSDADQVILFLLEQGFDVQPWQWDVIMRSMGVDVD